MSARGASFPKRLWVGLAGLAAACVGLVALFARATPTGRVREAAVAGAFYPAEKDALAAEVRRLLEAAPAVPLPPIRALVVPHAGYVFSGPTAACAYRQVAGRDVRRAILLASSHYAAFDGAMIPAVDAFATPLGRVPLAPLAAELAKRAPFTSHPEARVQRPGWAWQSALRIPPGEDDPHTWDHTLEVQLPFLQVLLPNVQVVPVLYGRVDPAAAAKEIDRALDDTTLVIASSDLSHYHPYDAARALDLACVKAMVELDTAAMASKEACGQLAIMTVIELAKKRGWQARLLDYRNSGDTAGERSRVVGYSAVAFVDAKGAPAMPGPLAAAKEEAGAAYAPADRKRLLALARETIAALAAGKAVPARKDDDFSPALREAKGCFVTLTKGGQLRGCIGHIVPQEALWRAVMDNAQSAAFRDGRFPPVTKDELKEIAIEISVLTVPRPLAFSSPEDLAKKLRPHVDGVVLRIGARGATYLPQVWEHFPNAEPFLSSLAVKAGCPADAWKGPGVEVHTYQVEPFHE
jgi:AmmeMemoRadiSam system protein B/AmmeMemoRadiSam system protein A